MWGTAQNLGPIGSAIYDIYCIQTDRQAKFMYRLGFHGASRASCISILYIFSWYTS